MDAVASVVQPTGGEGALLGKEGVSTALLVAAG